METIMAAAYRAFEPSISPHSLGKLIEWKRTSDIGSPSETPQAPHSLGKLIEWKLAVADRLIGYPSLFSPLAGETN